jgi:hypothetical protein
MNVSLACMSLLVRVRNFVKNNYCSIYLIERMETEKYKEEKVCESGFLLGRIEN